MKIKASQDRKTGRIKRVLFEADSFQDEQFLSKLFFSIKNNEKIYVVGEDGKKSWISGVNS